MNQSEFLAITCSLLRVQEKLHIQGAIGFASHCLDNWQNIFKPIANNQNCNLLYLTGKFILLTTRAVRHENALINYYHCYLLET